MDKKNKHLTSAAKRSEPLTIGANRLTAAQRHEAIPIAGSSRTTTAIVVLVERAIATRRRVSLLHRREMPLLSLLRRETIIII